MLLLARRQAGALGRSRQAHLDWTPHWTSLLPTPLWSPPQTLTPPPVSTGTLVNHKHVVPRATGLKPGDETACTLCHEHTDVKDLKKFMATKCPGARVRDGVVHLEHDLVLPPNLEAPKARARCTRCGASALTKKRSHGSTGLDWLRGTRCKGAARGQQPAKADPSGNLSPEARAAAMRAHNAKLQRERRAKGSCLNKPAHRDQQRLHAKTKRQVLKENDKSSNPPLSTSSLDLLRVSQPSDLAPSSPKLVGGAPLPVRGRKRPRLESPFLPENPAPTKATTDAHKENGVRSRSRQAKVPPLAAKAKSRPKAKETPQSSLPARRGQPKQK